MSFRSRDELIGKLKSLKPRIQHQWPVSSLALFGSWSRDDAHKSSDVDVLVEFAEVVSLFKFADLKLLLEDELGCPVDLVDRAALKPRLAPRILSEAVEL